MTNPKLVERSEVNLAVWVKKPGPIADVAIKKAAPKIAEFFFMRVLTENFGKPLIKKFTLP